MSNSQIPNPLPSPPGGAHGAYTAPGQFSGAAQGVPYQGGAQPMPTPQAWGQPGPYAMARPTRPQLSTRVRVCLRLELILWVIALVNIFIPYFFDDLSIYFERFTSVWFYESVITYIAAIVLSAVALKKRSNAVRYALVGVVLVSFLLIDPVFAVLEGGRWYWLFMPPTLDPSVFGDVWYASLLVVRMALIWLIVRSGLIIAIVLAVPDRRSSASAPSVPPSVLRSAITLTGRLLLSPRPHRELRCRCRQPRPHPLRELRCACRQPRPRRPKGCRCRLRVPRLRLRVARPWCLEFRMIPRRLRSRGFASTAPDSAL